MVESSALKDLGSYKTKLISAFVNSEEILECLFNKQPYTEDDVENLTYSQIFPYLYTDETQTETKTYICVDVKPVSKTRTMKNSQLVIWVYCHKDIMEYSKKGYSGTRVDILADMIERALRDSNKFGIGKMEFDEAPYFSPHNKYYGRQIFYNVSDFKVKEV